jgi:hemolysin activation/secretion protein
MTASPATALVLTLAGAVSLAADAAPSRVEMIDARTGEGHVPPAAADLQARLAPLLAEADSPEGVERVVDAVLEHARMHGRPVMEVEAVPPPAGAAGGSAPLRLLVWPGLISSHSLEGGSPGMRAVMADDWTRRTGEELDLHDVEAWLDWTHRNPFHQVTLSFEPGAEPATADGVLTLHSEAAVRTFVAWRDDGVEPLGPQRFSAGFELADAAGLPVWVSGELVGGEDWPDYRSGRGQLRWFLPWHHELRLAGSLTTAELDGFLPGLPITSSLDSSELNARYVVPLGKPGGWWVDAGIGFDFRRTESGVAVDGELDNGRADTAQGVVEATLRRVTDDSEAVAVVGGFWSPGGMTAYNDTEDVEVLRPGAEADYAGVRFDGLSRWELPRGWALIVRGAAQWTSAPPLPTVQLAVSGANAVRGFDEAVVLADAGAWGGLEVQSPSWSVPRVRPGTRLTPLVFADAGWARNEAEDDESTLASAGIGLRMRNGGRLGLAFDYGWRLTEPGGRAHFALVLSF